MVTGHLGYIGSVLTPVLEAAGHTVVGVDAGLFVDERRASEHGGDGRSRLDVRRLGVEDLRDVDAVAHLAALSNDPMGQLDPRLTDEVNHGASVRLARLARDAGVERFVFASSCSLYGGADTSRPLDETAPFNPVTAYAQSKVDGEAGVSALTTDEFSPVFLRNATAFGLSSAMRFDLVVNNMVGWALTTGRVRLMSDGSPWRPLVHVLDIARACLSAVEAPREAVHNQAFNIGRDDLNFRIRDIAIAVQNRVPGCAVEMADGAGPDRRSYRVSFAKAAERLPGFRPEWTLEAGIEEMVDHFSERGLTEHEFLGRPRVRIEQLRHLLTTSRLDSKLYWTEPVAAS